MKAAGSSSLGGASRVRLVAAAAGSGVLMYLSSADALVPALAWVAPVPILAYGFAAGPSRRLALGSFLAGLAGNLAWVALYRGILPVVPLLGFVLLFAAAFALAAWLTAWVAARRGAWAGVFLFPLLWVSFEFAVSRWSPHGTAGSLAYSQIDFILFIQLAAWTGLSGLVFVVELVAAGIAAALGSRGPRGARWLLFGLPALALAAVVALGAWRVHTPSSGSSALVGLVSIDDGMKQFETTSAEEATRVVTSYLDAAGTLAGRQVEAVVMPEKMVGVTPIYEQQVFNLLASAAGEERHLLIVAGLNLVGRKQPRNVAIVFSQGRKALEYDKQHLVPGLEADYAPGGRPGVFKAPGGMTGVAICKDLDFADVGRDYGRAGIGLLFVPAWDFTRDAWLHSRMAVMRGVEGGFSVARAAADGLLTGSDEFGRVLAERRSDAARESMAMAMLPIARGRTFYAEHGDWLGWSALVAAALLLTSAATQRSTA